MDSLMVVARDGVAEDFVEVEFAGFAVGGEGLVQGLDEGGFDLGAGVQFAGAGEDDGAVGDLFRENGFGAVVRVGMG